MEVAVVAAKRPAPKAKMDAEDRAEAKRGIKPSAAEERREDKPKKK